MAGVDKYLFNEEIRGWRQGGEVGGRIVRLFELGINGIDSCQYSEYWGRLEG